MEKWGTETGPNLAAFANRGAAAIVTNILDPNREVDPRYLTYLVRTRDGQLLEGMILDETAASVSLQSSDGKTHTILRAEIEELKSAAVSLMPENLESEIDRAAMQDLVAYLLSQSG